MVTQDCREWALDPCDFYEDLQSLPRPTRRPTFVACRAVPLHTDVPVQQQVLVYRVVANPLQATFFCGENSFQAKAGDVFCFDPGQPHGLTAGEHPGVWIGVALSLNFRAAMHWLSTMKTAG